MLRNTFYALTIVLAAGAAAQAAITLSIDSGVAAPNLAGFKKYTVTATSTVNGEFITGVDMIGDPAAPVDPATSKGFFGAFNQVAAGPFATPLQDFNSFMPQPDGPQQDTQFLVSTTAPTGAVNSPTGFSKESATTLQALFSRDTGFGQAFPLAQLVISDTATATVNWRGAFSVLRGGVNVDENANGTLTTGGGTQVPPNILLNDALERDGGAGVINLVGTLVAAPAPTPPIVWSNLTLTSSTIPANAATLDAAGNFSWNPLGSKAGKKGSGNVLYTWSATATGPGGADTDVAFRVVLIPEPASMALFGFAAIGAIFFARRRSL